MGSHPSKSREEWGSHIREGHKGGPARPVLPERVSSMRQVEKNLVIKALV